MADRCDSCGAVIIREHCGGMADIDMVDEGLELTGIPDGPRCDQYGCCCSCSDCSGWCDCEAVTA